MKTRFTTYALALGLCLSLSQNLPANPTDSTKQPQSEMQKSYKKKAHGEKHKHRGMLNPRLIRALELTEAQRMSLSERRSATEQKRSELKAEKSRAEKDMKEALAALPLDKKRIKEISERILLNQRRFSELRLEGVVFFVELLTPQQHAKFVEMQTRKS